MRVILEFKLPAESSSLATTCPAELNQCKYGSVIVPLYNVMVTDVPAAMPFRTHVSQGLLRGLRPPVPLPEIVVVTELTAATELVVNNNIASDAMNAETSERAVKRVADERRECADAAPISGRIFVTIFTTNSAPKLYVHNMAKHQCRQGFQ